MKFLRINRFKDTFGNPDYKGINIKDFVANSQVFFIEDDYCIIAINKEYTPHEDIVELDEQGYTTEREAILTRMKQTTVTLEQQIKELQAQNAQILISLVNKGAL